MQWVLAAGSVEDRGELAEAVAAYATVKERPDTRVEPWQIVNANRVLDRYAAFKHELNERYSQEAFDWWRQKLQANAYLLASYQERREQEARPAPPKKTQQRSRRTGLGYLFILPLIGVLNVLFNQGSSPSLPSPVHETARVPAQIAVNSPNVYPYPYGKQSAHPLEAPASVVATRVHSTEEGCSLSGWIRKLNSSRYSPKMRLSAT